MKVPKHIWEDPVWSKVIAAGIISLVGVSWAGIRFDRGTHLQDTLPTPLWLQILLSVWVIISLFLVFRERKQRGEPVLGIVKIEAQLGANPALKYPLKCYVWLRNDSPFPIDVTISRYIPKTVIIKGPTPAALRLRFEGQWGPSEGHVDRIAAYPGQKFEAWIGVDEAKFTVEQVNRLVGT